MSYFDDYEAYIEPSELDTLTDEYLEKVKEHFKDRFKEQIKLVDEQAKKNTENMKILGVRELTLNMRETEINQKYEDLEKHKGNLLFEWLSQYGLDLNPGQKVYTIKENTEWEDCPKCKGTGKIKVKSEDGIDYDMDCPDCLHNYRTGKKRKTTYSVQPMYVVNVSIKLGLKRESYSKDMLKAFVYGEHEYEYTPCSIELNKKENCDYDSEYYNRKNIYLTEEDCKKALEEKGE